LHYDTVVIQLVSTFPAFMKVDNYGHDGTYCVQLSHILWNCSALSNLWNLKAIHYHWVVHIFPSPSIEIFHPEFVNISGFVMRAAYSTHLIIFYLAVLAVFSN
jgi:hypothetical protein